MGEGEGVRGLSTLKLLCEFNYIEFSWQPENAHTTVLVVCALCHYADQYFQYCAKKKKKKKSNDSGLQLYALVYWVFYLILTDIKI